MPYSHLHNKVDHYPFGHSQHSGTIGSRVSFWKWKTFRVQKPRADRDTGPNMEVISKAEKEELQDRYGFQEATSPESSWSCAVHPVVVRERQDQKAPSVPFKDDNVQDRPFYQIQGPSMVSNSQISALVSIQNNSPNRVQTQSSNDRPQLYHPQPRQDRSKSVWRQEKCIAAPSSATSGILPDSDAASAVRIAKARALLAAMSPGERSHMLRQMKQKLASCSVQGNVQSGEVLRWSGFRSPTSPRAPCSSTKEPSRHQYGQAVPNQGVAAEVLQDHTDNRSQESKSAQLCEPPFIRPSMVGFTEPIEYDSDLEVAPKAKVLERARVKDSGSRVSKKQQATLEQSTNFSPEKGLPHKGLEPHVMREHVSKMERTKEKADKDKKEKKQAWTHEFQRVVDNAIARIRIAGAPSTMSSHTVPDGKRSRYKAQGLLQSAFPAPLPEQGTSTSSVGLHSQDPPRTPKDRVSPTPNLGQRHSQLSPTVNKRTVSSGREYDQTQHPYPMPRKNRKRQRVEDESINGASKNKKSKTRSAPTEQASAEPQTAEPTGEELTEDEPMEDEPTIADPPTAEPTGEEPTNAEPTIAEPTSIEQPIAEPFNASGQPNGPTALIETPSTQQPAQAAVTPQTELDLLLEEFQHVPDINFIDPLDFEETWTAESLIFDNPPSPAAGEESIWDLIEEHPTPAPFAEFDGFGDPSGFNTQPIEEQNGWATHPGLPVAPSILPTDLGAAPDFEELSTMGEVQDPAHFPAVPIDNTVPNEAVDSQGWITEQMADFDPQAVDFRPTDDPWPLGVGFETICMLCSCTEYRPDCDCLCHEPFVG